MYIAIKDCNVLNVIVFSDVKRDYVYRLVKNIYIFIRHFISLVRTLTKKYRHNKRNNIISQQKCALYSLINKNVQIKRPQFFGIYSAKEKDE